MSARVVRAAPEAGAGVEVAVTAGSGVDAGAAAGVPCRVGAEAWMDAVAEWRGTSPLALQQAASPQRSQACALLGFLVNSETGHSEDRELNLRHALGSVKRVKVRATGDLRAHPHEVVGHRPALPACRRLVTDTPPWQVAC